jgi:hypothetical protein
MRARIGASQIPRAVAAAIKTCWPNGVVEEFATDESYFHDTRPTLERDLRNIRGASLLWETEEDDSSGWDEDADGLPRASEDWQSYCVFFLAPDGKAFHFEYETDEMEEPEEPIPRVTMRAASSVRCRMACVLHPV